jgi:hypothetical protein
MDTNSSNSSLLNRTVDGHGGLERWREVRYLDVRLSVSGGLFQINGHPEGLHDVFMRIKMQRPAVTIVPFGRPDCRGHFTPTRVWIEDREVSCRRGTCRPPCVVRRTCLRDTLGSAAAALLHGLRQLELLHRAIFAHTVWCQRPRDWTT